MLNKNLLLLNTTLNDYTTRLFSDTFYEDDEEVLPRIYPYIMDQRILRPRLKTILEMKPDLLWDANYGCINNLGAICTSNQYVTKWIDRVQGIELTSTGSSTPIWYEYGMCDQPSVLFDNNDLLEIASVVPSLLNAVEHTVFVLGYPLDFASVPRAIVFTNTLESNRYLLFGIEGDGKMTTKANGDGTFEGMKNTVTTTTAPHAFIFTNNSPTEWSHIIDGVEYELEIANIGGNTGRSFGGVSGLNRTRMGYSTSSNYWYGHIAMIAIWGRAI